MKTQSLLILSTAHLHPLEAQKIDEVAYVANQECALVRTQEEMREFYYGRGLVCLCNLLDKVKKDYSVEFVLFDPDADTLDELVIYSW